MENKAVYEKRIIAFVGILGFKTLIDDSKIDTTIRRKIKSAMEIVYEAVNKDIDSSVRMVSTFSDSAVISYVGDEHNSLFDLLIDIIHLQIKLGALGILVRGGIAFGDCYHDGDIVFGPAMNEAYFLESKVAEWPRVVISKRTLEMAIKESVDHGTCTEKYELEEIYSCLREDEENKEIMFVDYLCQSQEIIVFGDEYLEWLRKFREAIIKGLNRYSKSNKAQYKIKTKTDSEIFKKYRKISAYWNSVLDDDTVLMPVPKMSREEQLEFRKMHKRLVIPKKYPYISVE